MSMLDTLKRWLGGPVVNETPPVPSSQITRNSSSWGYLVGYTGIDGIPGLTENSAMSVSAIAACTNLIGGAISSIPLHVYTRTKKGVRERRYDDELWWVLNEEWSPRWSAAAGWEFLVKSRLLHGDAFAVILRDRNGVPKGLVPVHPQRVFVVPNLEGTRLLYLIEPDPTIPVASPARQRVVLDQDDVIHISGDGFDGCRSMSPLSYHLRVTGAVASVTQDYSARFFANGARPDYALTTAQQLTPAYIDDLRSKLEERHSGYQKSHLPMVLHGGLDVKQIQLPLEELQLLATREFQIEDIARAFGVPPFMIGHTSKTTSWGSGMGTMGQNFVTFTLAPHLAKIHNEFNRKLFRTYTRVVEFDTFELERADLKSMFESFRIAIGRAGEPGFLTVNEVRRFFNFSPKTGGNQLMKATPDAPLEPSSPEPDPEEQGEGAGNPGGGADDLRR